MYAWNTGNYHKVYSAYFYISREDYEVFIAIFLTYIFTCIRERGNIKNGKQKCVINYANLRDISNRIIGKFLEVTVAEDVEQNEKFKLE